MKQKVLELLKKFLPTLVKVAGIQLQSRVSPHVRAMGFGLSTFLSGLALYRGWVELDTAAFLWGQIVTLFLLDIVNKAPGEKTSFAVQQVATVIPSPDPPTPLQTRVSISIPVPKTDKPSATIPLGEEFPAKESR